MKLKEQKGLFIILMGLILCASMLTIYLTADNGFNDIMKFKKEYETYNEKEYLAVHIKNSDKISYVTEDELLNKMDSETAVFYFGFPTCPWCRNIVEPLLEVTKKENVKLYYFNPSDMRAGNSDTYQKLIKKLEKYLSKNEEGKETLYVPDVYFIKDGKIVGNHLGSVDSQKNPNKKLSANELQELVDIYNENIKKMK